MDPQVIKTLAIVIFAATYVMLMIFSKIRPYIALSSALLFVLIGAIPIGGIFSAVDWNVIMMIAGTMGIVYFFIESKMPALLADLIIEKTPNVKWAIISMSLFAGIISAFVDNVATVLMVAPVALTISKKLKISPVSSIISIAIASNLQGAATLVGDTTSILLGAHAQLDFLDFFFMQGRIGLFWVVQAGAITATLVLMYVFKKDVQPIDIKDRTKITDYFPTYLLSGTIVLLILASFIPTLPSNPADRIAGALYKPNETNGYICMAIFLIGIIRELIVKKDFKSIKPAIMEIDFFTILLLAGLFIIIGGIEHVGFIDDISSLFLKISDNPFVLYTIIVWFSVIISAFIDNIPYVATMLPVVGTLSAQLGGGSISYLLSFGLLVGATLGGNLTPIGASANITGLGILRKAGYEVSPKTFMKISVPFTLVAVFTGYILVWFIWK